MTCECHRDRECRECNILTGPTWRIALDALGRVALIGWSFYGICRFFS